MSKPVTALTECKVVEIYQKLVYAEFSFLLKRKLFWDLLVVIFLFFVMPSGICDGYIESEG